jgi:hypothetical protein
MVCNPIVNGLIILLGVLDVLMNLGGIVRHAGPVDDAIKKLSKEDNMNSTPYLCQVPIWIPTVRASGSISFAVWISMSRVAAGDAGWK